MQKKLLILVGLVFIAALAFWIDPSILPAGDKMIVGSHIPTPIVRSVTAAATLSVDDEILDFDTNGGAITFTLPNPALNKGKCYNMFLSRAGSAVTLNAGTFSINGATTNNAMDAVGDGYVLCSNGAGYFTSAAYIH